MEKSENIILAIINVKRFLKHITWTLSGEAINKIVLFFAILYFGKILGSESFGLFSLFQSIVMYLVILIEISSSMYGAREVAKCESVEKSIEVGSYIYGLRVFLAIIVFSVYVITINLINIDFKIYMVALAFSAYIIAYGIFTEWFHKGRENFKYVAISSLFQALFFLFFLFFLRFYDNKVFLSSLLWSTSFIIFALFLIYFQKTISRKRLYPRFDIKEWKNNIHNSYHFPINGVLGMGYQYFPIFFLSYFHGLTAVGEFSLIYKVVFAICGFVFYIPSVLYPKFTFLFHNDTEKFVELQKKLLLIMVFIAFIYGIFAVYIKHDFIDYFKSEGYMQIEEIYDIIVWVAIGYFIRFSYNIPLMAMGKERSITKQMFYASGFVLLPGFFIIMNYGTMGASFVLLVGEIIVVLNAVLEYRKNIPSISKSSYVA